MQAGPRSLYLWGMITGTCLGGLLSIPNPPEGAAWWGLALGWPVVTCLGGMGWLLLARWERGDKQRKRVAERLNASFRVFLGSRTIEDAARLLHALHRTDPTCIGSDAQDAGRLVRAAEDYPTAAVLVDGDGNRTPIPLRRIPERLAAYPAIPADAPTLPRVAFRVGTGAGVQPDSTGDETTPSPPPPPAPRRRDIGGD